MTLPSRDLLERPPPSFYVIAEGGVGELLPCEGAELALEGGEGVGRPRLFGGEDDVPLPLRERKRLPDDGEAARGEIAAQGGGACHRL